MSPRSQSSETSLESTPVRVRAGTITVEGDRLTFTTSDKQGQAVLPARAEPVLRRLANSACDLEQLVIEAQSKGQTVDYRLLLTMLLGLYHGDCLKNRSDFRVHFESWQMPPLEDPHLLEPLHRTRAAEIDSTEGTLLFAIACATCFAEVTLVSGAVTFGLPPTGRLWLAVFLLPSAALSIIALLHATVGSFLGHKDFRLGARFSPIGPHLEPDARCLRRHPLEHVLLALACSIFLPLLATLSMQAQLLQAANDAGVFGVVMTAISLLLIAVQLFPGLRTPLGFARDEWIRSGRLGGDRPAKGLPSILAGIGLGAAAIYISTSNYLLLTQLFHWRALFSLGSFAYLTVLASLLLWATLLFWDLGAGLATLAQDFPQLENRLNRLRAEGWWHALFSGTESARKKIDRAFRKHPLFQMLPEALRKDLQSRSRLHKVARGFQLIRQGARSTELFLLISGSAGIYRRGREADGLAIRITSGAVFGEAGFFLGEPRSADVITLEPSEVIVIPRPPGMNRLEIEAANVQDVFRRKIWASQALAGSELFQTLPAEALLHILNYSDPVTLSPGTLVVGEGEGADALWICIQGTASVSVQGSPRPDIEAGGVIGEIGLLWNVPRTASVVTRTECVFLKLSAPAFHRLLSRNLRLASHLQELGAHRLERDKKVA